MKYSDPSLRTFYIPTSMLGVLHPFLRLFRITPEGRYYYLQRKVMKTELRQVSAQVTLFANVRTGINI
jgi:hypothetical protein